MLRPQVRSSPGLKRSCAERDPDLRRPAVDFLARRRPPHQVEGQVEGLLGVGGMHAIDADPRRAHAEDDRGAAIQERVERDQDVLGLGDVVAPAERRLDLRAVAARHPGADVERAVVVGETHLHVVGGHAAFGRLLHHEVGDRLGGLPGLVGDRPVDGDGAVVDAHGGRALERPGLRDRRRLGQGGAARGQGDAAGWPGWRSASRAETRARRPAGPARSYPDPVSGTMARSGMALDRHPVPAHRRSLGRRSRRLREARPPGGAASLGIGGIHARARARLLPRVRAGRRLHRGGLVGRRAGGRGAGPDRAADRLDRGGAALRRAAAPRPQAGRARGGLHPSRRPRSGWGRSGAPASTAPATSASSPSIRPTIEAAAAALERRSALTLSVVDAQLFLGVGDRQWIAAARRPTGWSDGRARRRSCDHHAVSP